MKRIIYPFLALATVFLPGCGNKTRTLSISDPQLAPILQAVAASDRATLGFSSIPTNAVVYLDSRSDVRHDVNIIVFDSPALYYDIHRDIELRKTETGYQWIRELETHPGPKTFTQSGHTKHEEIYIAYDTTQVMGITPNKLHIHYEGPGSQFASGKELKLDQVRPFLAEWSQKH
jgi:hypothetical protein